MGSIIEKNNYSSVLSYFVAMKETVEEVKVKELYKHNFTVGDIEDIMKWSKRDINAVLSEAKAEMLDKTG